MADLIINITDSVLIELNNAAIALNNDNITEAKMSIDQSDRILSEMRDVIEIRKSLSEAGLQTAS